MIGIGAGNGTDGQILVMHDMFGISANYMPKFSKNFLAETGDMRTAVAKYMEDVANGTFLMTRTLLPKGVFHADFC